MAPEASEKPKVKLEALFLFFSLMLHSFCVPLHRASSKSFLFFLKAVKAHKQIAYSIVMAFICYI